jgi:cardiolipin synthase
VGPRTSPSRRDRRTRAARPGRRLAVLAALVAAACSQVAGPRIQPRLDTGQPAFRASISAHSDSPFVGGNRVEVLLNGDGTFPRLLGAIRGARRSITFQQYFFDQGPISDEVVAALADRCRHGVRVHVLLDSVGGSGIEARHRRLLERSGCEFAWYRPIELLQFLTPWELLAFNNRSHRRILVVDGEVGFTGGYGISEAWMGGGARPDRWRDTNVEVRGPIVRALQAAFVQDWWATTGTALVGDDYFPDLPPAGGVTAQVVASSPAGGASDAYMMFLLAISSARRSIHVTNPYFVIDDAFAEEFIRAAKRGVEVMALVPGRIENELLRVDQNLVHYAGRGELGPLLEAGVRVFEYEAALLHAKTMVVDGVWATIGSTNFDPRSFELNDELNVTVLDAGVARQLEEIFRRDLERSREVTYAEWQARGLKQRILEVFAFPAKSQL